MGLSDEEYVLSLMPQGTVLVPVLIDNISHIKEVKESKAKRFVDDTRVCKSIGAEDKKY